MVKPHANFSNNGVAYMEGGGNFSVGALHTQQVLSQAMSNRILLIGDSDIDKLVLVQDVLRRSNQPAPDSLDAPVGWHIDTKYYTAQVFFSSASSADDTLDGDAVVFVYNKQRSGAFKQLEEWMERIEQLEPSIQLCVAMGEGDSEGHEDWCLDHGFDFVDLSTAADEDRKEERVAVERVIEVLEANMWESMERKQDPREQDSAQKGELRGTNEQAGKRDESKEGEHGEKDDPENDDPLGEEADMQRLLLNDQDMPNNEEVQALRQEIFGDLDEEDGFDNALEKLRGLKAKAQTLSDDERRKLAAKVALSFFMEIIHYKI
ncbi:uncharacterized protein VTP21DRAFT_9217 [Calcarisporiella thermophila]|uniref:uncharacterized protein n=1 Tax=Calcarisporiella thermophila TaxID=911321 RepID=UPI003743FACB